MTGDLNAEAEQEELHVFEQAAAVAAEFERVVGDRRVGGEQAAEQVLLRRQGRR